MRRSAMEVSLSAPLRAFVRAVRRARVITWMDVY